MTVQEWIVRMDKRLSEMTEDKIMKTAITDIIADVATRVFVDGNNSKNTKIGVYSKKLMLATKSQFPNVSKFKQSDASSGITYSQNIKTRKIKTHRQKSGNKKLWIKFPKASKAVPIMIIEGGYDEFKKIVKGTNTVNLWLFGDLRSDVSSAFLVKQKGGYDWKFKRQLNAKKVEYLTEHFGSVSIFGLTKGEEEKVNRTVKAEVLRLMNQ